MSPIPEPTELPHTFEIGVPTKCICGELLPKVEREEVLDDVKSTLSKWFGGYTAIRVEGGWVHSDDSRLAKEPSDVVTSYATDDDADEFKEEFTMLVADLANRLTQEAMICRINGKILNYPSTTLPKPHRCMGGGTRGELPMPIQSSQKQSMLHLEASLQRISSVRDARDLFCNVLHYDRPDDFNAELPMVNWPDKLKKCLAPGTAPRIIADEKGFKIIYFQLAENYLRKGHERQLVQRIIHDNPTLRGLVVVSDVNQKQ
ncbi:hypothetical protein OAG97_02605, partial [Akkermansiaceae bacterium]|nr:hypothetical protein [Akkermansiaceae bacterium]